MSEMRFTIIVMSSLVSLEIPRNFIYLFIYLYIHECVRQLFEEDAKKQNLKNDLHKIEKIEEVQVGSRWGGAKAVGERLGGLRSR